MPPQLALAIVVAVVFVLWRIEAHGMPKASFALLVPTVWMMLAASRPVSRWLFYNSEASEGSLPDRLTLAVLILLSVLILMTRKVDWPAFFKNNFWLILFFAYMGISTLWTDVPFIAFKRWIRTSGAIAVAMVVMTEQVPLQAFERILRRCAYVLIPLSIVFIKYYPAFGRTYGRWDGVVMWTGVTTQKNSLGALCAVSILVIVLTLFRRNSDSAESRSKLRPYADLGVLAGAVILLRGEDAGTYSATAVGVTLVGVAVCAALAWRRRGGRFIAVHLRPIAVATVIAHVALWDVVTSAAAGFLGRRTDLTGRATEIWPLVLQEAARHPVFGSGYGGVWGLRGKLSTVLGLEQAHNGYLDVYLQLGIVGCVLLALFLLEFCARTGQQVRYDRRWGVFGVAFLFMNLVYNLSETAFFDVYLGTALVFTTVIFGASGANVIAKEAVDGAEVSAAGAHGRQSPRWRSVPFRRPGEMPRWNPQKPAQALGARWPGRR